MNERGSHDLDARLDAALSEWLAAEAPRRARPEVLEHVLARTAPSRQTSGLALRLGGSWAGLPVRLAIAAIVVAATVGGLAISEGRFPGVPLVPNPQLPAGALTWTRLDATSAFENAVVDDVVAGGPGLIALGSVESGGQGVAAAWTSADGVAWRRAAVPADSVPPPVPNLSYGIASTMRLVRSGSHVMALIHPECAASPIDCARMERVWLTEDGERWTDETTALGVCRADGCTLYQLMTAAAPGFVLAGPRFDSRSAMTGPVIATSADGVHWTTRPTGNIKADAIAAVAGSRTGLVVVGDSSGSPAVWTSSDFVTLQSVPASSAPPSGELADVVAAGPGYVAVGRDAGGAASWLSANGSTWRESRAAPGLAEATMYRVLDTGLGLVALGRASDGNGAAWYSKDGLSWTQLATGPAFSGGPVRAAASLGQHLILFGTDQHGKTVLMIGS